MGRILKKKMYFVFFVVLWNILRIYLDLLKACGRTLTCSACNSLETKKVDTIKQSALFYQAVEPNALSGKAARLAHLLVSGEMHFLQSSDVCLCLCALMFPPNLVCERYLFGYMTYGSVGGDSQGNNSREGACLDQISLSNSICSQHLESIMVYSVR